MSSQYFPLFEEIKNLAEYFSWVDVEAFIPVVGFYKKNQVR